MSTIHACWSHQADSVENTLQVMLTASDYWRPDKKSSWVSKHTYLGLAKAQLFNTQNSINDGVYHDDVTQLSITANARIDNRKALLTQLRLNAEDPRIETDSQLILECYKKWGRECAAYLRGDFVFVIWDEARQKLFCARDHFGVKVLFYAQNEKGVMLSNEHNAFFTSSWCDKASVDEKWLVENLWNLGPLDFNSPNPEIHILPPAHILEIDSNGVQCSQFWRLQPKNDWQGLDDETLISELKKRFKHAVSLRLDSKYPIGAELSEGLDSNGIVGYAAQVLKPAPIYTFSYHCDALNESNRHIWEHTYKDIEGMLAMHANLQPVWQSDSLEVKQRNLECAHQSFYQNFGAVIPIKDHFLRSQLTQSKGVQVILSGWGGDHCVTCPGDEYANELFRKGRMVQLYRLLKNKYKRGRGRHPLRSALTTALRHIYPSLNLYLKTRRPCLETALRQRGQCHFLNEKWQAHFNLNKSLERFIQEYQRNSVQQYEIRELFEIGLTNRLTCSELVARQYRLEYRFPMLDVDLIEFAHSLPSRLKIHQGIERYPFRRLLEGVTTQRIQWRRKADISFPNLDRAGEDANTHAQLTKKLVNSPLISRYSSQESLKTYIESNAGPHQNLRFIADFDAYYK